MENGTRAQFRGTKQRNENKNTHTTPAGFQFLSFFFLLLVNAAFLFKLAQNQVKSQKGTSLSTRATTTHTNRSNINLISTETLAGSVHFEVPLMCTMFMFDVMRWSCCRKQVITDTGNSVL